MPPSTAYHLIHDELIMDGSSRFNLATGKVTGLPAVIPAKTYPVKVEGSDIYVEVPE